VWGQQYQDNEMMKQTLLWMLAALILIAGRAPKASAQTVAMECAAGRYTDTVKSIAGGGANCARKGTGLGLAIDVKPSPSAYANDPPCGQGDNTDQLVRDLARAAAAEKPGPWVASFRDFWSRFLRRSSSFGNDFGGLAQGAFIGKSGSRCQIFVVPIPVPAKAITAIEFQSGQSGKPPVPCFRTEVRSAPESKEPFSLARNGGACEAGSSGWRSGLLVDNRGGTVVAAVFKNWSTTQPRTGVLWVWY
jgi:hypothetical protein